MVTQGLEGGSSYSTPYPPLPASHLLGWICPLAPWWPVPVLFPARPPPSLHVFVPHSLCCCSASFLFFASLGGLLKTRTETHHTPKSLELTASSQQHVQQGPQLTLVCCCGGHSALGPLLTGCQLGHPPTPPGFLVLQGAELGSLHERGTGLRHALESSIEKDSEGSGVVWCGQCHHRANGWAGRSSQVEGRRAR